MKFTHQIYLIIALTLLSISFTHMVFAQDDKTIPTIVSFDFSPKSVDTRYSAQTITFTAHFTDDLSGFDYGEVRFYSPSRQQILDATWYLSRIISGDKMDGTYVYTATLPQYAEAGTWQLDYFGVHDQVHNSKYWNLTDITQWGFPTQFQVTSLATPTATLTPIVTVTPTATLIATTTPTPSPTISPTATITPNVMPKITTVEYKQLRNENGTLSTKVAITVTFSQQAQVTRLLILSLDGKILATIDLNQPRQQAIDSQITVIYDFAQLGSIPVQFVAEGNGSKSEPSTPISIVLENNLAKIYLPVIMR